MDLRKFSAAKRFLYHLTYKENLVQIKKKKVLYSTSTLLNNADNKSVRQYLKTRRCEKIIITIGGSEISIRDQRPLSEKALSKCLTNGWSCEDYLICLNKRVFFWCDTGRLERHYNRYSSEEPIILRFNTDELLGINIHAKFSRINSGATRPNPHLGGIASARGIDTFLSSHEYDLPISSIAEVTFEEKCILPSEIEISNTPHGRWTRVDLR